MVTKKVIDSIYKTCKSRPETPDELNIALLFEALEEHHAIRIENGSIIINSIPPTSPFHKVALRCVHDIIEFADVVAIVLHSSIIFLNKNDNKTHIHIKQERPSFMDRIRYALTNAD